MTEAVSAALGIDKVDITGKLVVIDERHGSDANFLINTIISSSLEKEKGICLVLFHNTFRHYHNVGKRKKETKKTVSSVSSYQTALKLIILIPNLLSYLFICLSICFPQE